MKKTAIILGVVVLVLVGVLAVNKPSVSLRGAPPINAVSYNASTTVNTTSTVVFAPNSSIQFRSISNIGTGTVYLWFSSTSTGVVTGAGYALLQSSTLVMSDALGTLWTGNVFGVSGAVDNVVTSQW